MSQSWGQNLGLMEQKLAKKARFTCVVGAFDTSCHLTIGSSDHPTMCGIVSFALRLLERVANQGWQTAEKRNRLRGRQMVGWSDDPMVRWQLAPRPLTAKALAAGYSSFEAVDFRCCHPQLWDIIDFLIMSQSWGQNPGLLEQKLARKARFTCVVSAFDTSFHLTNGSSEHPTMCGIVSFALRLLERVT